MKKFAIILLAVCLFSLAAISVSAYDLADYTIPAEGVHFTFNNTYASTDPNLVGTPKGAISFIEDRNGNASSAVYFQAGDQHIELLKKDYTGDWTVSAWVKIVKDEAVNTEDAGYHIPILISSTAEIRSISNNSSAAPKNPGYMLIGKRNLAWDFAGASGIRDEWHMITFSYKSGDAPELHLYLNGVEQAHTGSLAPDKLIGALFANETLPLPLTLIGNDSADLGNTQMDQRTAMDDLYIFPKMLSAAEIATLYTTADNGYQAPSEDNGDNEGEGEGAPDTGSALIAVIAVATAAGAVVVSKKRR